MGGSGVRAYYKTSTQQPICLYLTADEAARLLEDLDCLDLERFPVVQRAQRALNKAFEELEATL